METATSLSIGGTLRHPVNFWVPARLLSLDGRRWFSCTVRHFGGPLWITHAAERVHGGMAGSPIVAEAGTAIGVVCATTSPREGGTNARLSHNLSGWLLPPLGGPPVAVFAAQWLACTLPCQRFTNGLTAARA